MGRGVGRKKLADWQRRLVRYERTGLTAAEFCKRERVSAALLKYWRRQVELAALRAAAPTKPSPQAAVFAAVEVIPRRWIVVRFPGGATLEIPKDQRFCPTHGERKVIGHDWQFEEVVMSPEGETTSRSSGNPIAFGTAPSGRILCSVFRRINGDIVQPITAFEVEG